MPFRQKLKWGTSYLLLGRNQSLYCAPFSAFFLLARSLCMHTSFFSKTLTMVCPSDALIPVRWSCLKRSSISWHTVLFCTAHSLHPPHAMSVFWKVVTQLLLLHADNLKQNCSCCDEQCCCRLLCYVSQSPQWFTRLRHFHILVVKTIWKPGYEPMMFCGGTCTPTWVFAGILK